MPESAIRTGVVEAELPIRQIAARLTQLADPPDLAAQAPASPAEMLAETIPPPHATRLRPPGGYANSMATLEPP